MDIIPSTLLVTGQNIYKITLTSHTVVPLTFIQLPDMWGEVQSNLVLSQIPEAGVNIPI